MIAPTPARIVRRRVERVFEQLSDGDFGALLDGMSDEVEHSFPGEHPLAGTRRGKAAVALWFERLGYLFPVHDFRVIEVLSSGPPWRLLVAVRWRAVVQPRLGDPYENYGMHSIRIERGKVVRLHAFLDSQAVAVACERMARAGDPQASAPPIG